MLLSSKRIAELLDDTTSDDPLVITPGPRTEDLRDKGAASIDLRLGSWFVKPRPRRLSTLDVQSDVGQPVSDYTQDSRITKTYFVPLGEYYVLHPRSFVLASTLEWIRLPSGIAGYVIGRSSWGRRGLVIATATGVHPRFSGCLTLELTNLGEIPIQIRPGLRICQIFLHEVSTSSKRPEESRFVGYRTPVLGRIEPDKTARSLWTNP